MPCTSGTTVTVAVSVTPGATLEAAVIVAVPADSALTSPVTAFTAAEHDATMEWFDKIEAKRKARAKGAP